MFVQFLTRSKATNSPFCQRKFKLISEFMEKSGMGKPLPARLSRDSTNIIVVWDDEEKKSVRGIALIHKATILQKVKIKILSHVHFCKKLLPSQKYAAFKKILELFGLQGASGQRTMYLDLRSLGPEIPREIKNACTEQGFSVSTCMMVK